MSRKPNQFPAWKRKNNPKRQRVLNATVSHEALIHAKLAAIQSGMTFRAFLDQLLLTAQPVPFKADSNSMSRKPNELRRT